MLLLLFLLLLLLLLPLLFPLLLEAAVLLEKLLLLLSRRRLFRTHFLVTLVTKGLAVNESHSDPSSNVLISLMDDPSMDIKVLSFLIANVNVDDDDLAPATDIAVVAA